MSLSFKFSSSGGGGGASFELIETQTASSSATIEFTDLSSTYSIYKVVIYNLVPVTDDANFYMRTSTDNGLSFDSGASDYSWVQNTNSDAADSEIQLASTVSNSANENLHGFVNIFNPGATGYTKIYSQHTYYSGFGIPAQSLATGQRLSTTAVDAIQFLFSTGNITTGTFKLYGLRAS